MTRFGKIITWIIVGLVAIGGIYLLRTPGKSPFNKVERKPLQKDNTKLVNRGRDIFRYDTFGDEDFFTDKLKLPFKVLMAIPPNARENSLGVMSDKDGKIVGIQEVKGKDGKTRYGITCAFCHSIVDERGNRLDGIPNHKLNIGAILNLSPTNQFTAKQRKEMLQWGPGRLDVTFANEAEDNTFNPAMNEAAFGTKGIKYFNWNGTFESAADRSHFTMDYVAHGKGSFVPFKKWHVKNKHAGKTNETDLIGPKMPAVVAYLESLQPPVPVKVSFNQVVATRGKTLFNGKAGCNKCHPAPLFTNNQKVKPSAVGTDPAHANSTAFNDFTYKVPQLRGVFAIGPYFHDGSAKTLGDVVNHYNKQFKLNLSNTEKADLVEYLKSI